MLGCNGVDVQSASICSLLGQENVEESGTRLGMVDDRGQRQFLLLSTSVLISGVGSRASHILPISQLPAQPRNRESIVIKYLAGLSKPEDTALRKIAHLKGSWPERPA